MKLEENWHLFLISFFTCLCPSGLCAPLITYNHNQCVPENTLIGQKYSSAIAIISLIIVLSMTLFYFLLPCTYYGLKNFKREAIVVKIDIKAMIKNFIMKEIEKNKKLITKELNE